MEENEKVSANNLEVADQENVADSEVIEETTEDNNEVIDESTTITEGNETTEDNEQEEHDGEKPKQSQEDNKVARMARIQAEKEAQKLIEKASKEAYEKGLEVGKIKTYIGKLNPYTSRPIKDDVDVREYLDMYEIDSNGGDPVKDYGEKVKEKAREDLKKQLEIEKQQQEKDFFDNDVKDFMNNNPQVKLEELFKNEKFKKFSKGKLGTQPLTEIYEDFTDIIGEFKNEAVKTAKKIVANNSTTPGGIENQESQEINWNNMSSEKFKEMLQKAKDGDLR